MPLFAGLNGDGFVQVLTEHAGIFPEDGVGPPSPVPVGPYTYHELAADALPAAGPRPTPTAQLLVVDGVLAWSEGVDLVALQNAAIAQTYLDVDAIYDVAVGRRTTEYANAEAAAREYAAAEVKPSVVSGYITGHARSNPTGQQQTNEWAAQQIIERADAFRWAELQMRNVRFDRQVDMRAAGDEAALESAAVSWHGFINFLRGVLGLPPT